MKKQLLNKENFIKYCQNNNIKTATNFRKIPKDIKKEGLLPSNPYKFGKDIFNEDAHMTFLDINEFNLFLDEYNPNSIEKYNDIRNKLNKKFNNKKLPSRPCEYYNDTTLFGNYRYSNKYTKDEFENWLIQHPEIISYSPYQKTYLNYKDPKLPCLPLELYGSDIFGNQDNNNDIFPDINEFNLFLDIYNPKNIDQYKEIRKELNYTYNNKKLHSHPCRFYNDSTLFGDYRNNEKYNKEEFENWLIEHPEIKSYSPYQKTYLNYKDPKLPGRPLELYGSDIFGNEDCKKIHNERIRIIDSMFDMNFDFFTTLYLYRQIYGISSNDKKILIKKYVKQLGIKRNFERVFKQNNAKRLKINQDELFDKLNDSEVIDFIYGHQIDSIWYDLINEKLTIDNIKNIEPEGKWNSKLKKDLCAEYDIVYNYKPVEGFNYRKNDKVVELNLMQKLIIVRSMSRKCYGNFSEPGTGKTIGDICLSRQLDAKITLIFAINSTIKNVWEDTIKRSYEDSNIIIISEFKNVDKELAKIDVLKHNYILINYEKLQIKEYSVKLINKISKFKIDKLTFDETQSIKETDPNAKKIRRINAEYLTNKVRLANPNVQVSVLSATIIINNLNEPKSILRILTGKKYDELNSNKSLDNLLNIHALIMNSGIRFVLPVKMILNEKILKINGNSIYNNIFVNKGGTIKFKNRKYIDDYKLMLPLKLNAILPYLKKGVILYSHFVQGFIEETKDFVEKNTNFSVGIFTGDQKDGLEMFINGEVDILVTSDPITTGIDGLQKISDTLIPLTLPWTHAMWHQLIHRIYRQGSIFEIANIIIPCIEIDVKDKKWSFDKDVMNRIEYKKQLSEYSLDSEIYENIKLKKDISIKRQDFINFLNKQKSNDEYIREYAEDFEIEDEKMSIDSITQKELQLASVSYSKTYSNHVNENTEHWLQYHNNRKKNWKVNPTEYLSSIIKEQGISDKIKIVDAGCGHKAEFADLFPNSQVYSYDLSNIGDERIIIKDISNLPHADSSIDIVIHSQAWECLNFNDYIKEAYRILNIEGKLYVVQSVKDWKEKNEIFTKVIIDNNFVVSEIKTKDKKYYITIIKQLNK